MKKNLMYQQARRLHQNGKLDTAANLYSQVIMEQPQHLDAIFHLATIFHQTGKANDALALVKILQDKDPGRADAYELHWQILRDRGDYVGAVSALEKKIELRPRDAYGYYHLAGIKRSQGKFAEALHFYKTAERWKTDDARLPMALGSLYKEQENWMDAVRCYEKAAALDTKNPHTHANLGYLYARQGKLQHSMAAYDKAQALDPDNFEFQRQRYTTLLRAGAYRTGFIASEARLSQPTLAQQQARYTEIPHWRGQNYTGQKLLVHAETDPIDPLQFARYLPMVKALGGRLALELPKTQLRLFSTLGYIDELLEESAVPVSTDRPDWVVAFASLPSIFSTTLDTVPANIPYLFAEPFLTHSWSLQMDWRRIRIAVDCEMEQLGPALLIPGIAWYAIRAMDAPQTNGTWTNVSGQLRDAADHAALLANMDLVIAADSTLTHLAGAMGSNVWMFQQMDAGWRWLFDRKASPWYPTLRIFRQDDSRNWVAPAQQVAEQLQRMVGIKHTAALAEAALR